MPRGLRNIVGHQSPTGGALVTRNGSEGRQREALLRRAYVGQDASCRQGRMPSGIVCGQPRRRQAPSPKQGGERLGWDAPALELGGLEQPQGRACHSSNCSAFWPQALCLAPPGLPLLAWQGVLLQTRAVGTLRASLGGFPAFCLAWEGFPASTLGLGMAA